MPQNLALSIKIKTETIAINNMTKYLANGLEARKKLLSIDLSRDPSANQSLWLHSQPENT